jgi:hypothetical protein
MNDNSQSQSNQKNVRDHFKTKQNSDSIFYLHFVVIVIRLSSVVPVQIHFYRANLFISKNVPILNSASQIGLDNKNVFQFFFSIKIEIRHFTIFLTTIFITDHGGTTSRIFWLIFINILHEPFSCKSALRSFSIITVLL